MYLTLEQYATRPSVFDYLVRENFGKYLRQGYFVINGEVVTDKNFPLQVGDIVVVKFNDNNRKNRRARIVGK